MAMPTPAPPCRETELTTISMVNPASLHNIDIGITQDLRSQFFFTLPQKSRSKWINSLGYHNSQRYWRMSIVLQVADCSYYLR